MIQLPFRTSADDRNCLEPAPSPLLPISCLLAIIVALAVLGAELGPRLAVVAAMFVAVSLATRLPRILPLTAGLCLALAAVTVLHGPASAGVATQAITHAAIGN